MKLYNNLKNNSLYPFHMPGHKRNPKFNIPSYELDITEIENFDNLHSPSGIIGELQDEFSRIYGFNHSVLSVNGSTCCILAAVSAVAKKNAEIIISRSCHKSVYNACMINRLNTVFIEPEFNESWGCFERINQKQIDKLLNEHPNACAVVITSPTYEGFISEIKCSVPLIIDSAHGAHFGMADWLPKKQNANIIIQSLHKTLPALTQTALIHIDDDILFRKVKKFMDIYETSSPSYVLMASADRCADFLLNRKKYFTAYKSLLDNFYSEISKYKQFEILPNDDNTRIIIRSTISSGYALAEHLRQCGIEPEGYTYEYVILISTVCDTKSGFDILLNALKSFECKDDKTGKLYKPQLPKKIYESYEIDAVLEADISEAVGKICGEYVFAYPPGCPIIAPGELIDEKTVKYILFLRENNINILSDSNLLPSKILTKR